MRRKLEAGQIWTSHDGSGLYRKIEYVANTVGGTIDVNGVSLSPGRFMVYYRTNRGDGLHKCLRSTFVSWLHVRKARKTQRGRRRKL